MMNISERADNGSRTLEYYNPINTFPSSANVRESEYCPSLSQSRKRYESVPEPMKRTPDYINKRIRNRSAVKRFREKSKTKAKRQEDVKAHLISLTRFYDNELIRIKHSKQQLELLLYQHAAHKNIIGQLNEILSLEAQARLKFQTQLASIQELPTSSIEHLVD